MADGNVTPAYRTLVVDPPWQMMAGPNKFAVTREGKPNIGHDPRTRPMAYPTMTLDEIKALPVDDLAEPEAHLYLWTTSAYVDAAYDVVRAWGFRPGQLLTWCKTPRGLGLGGAFVSTTEFVLCGRRGSLPNTARVDTSWWNWTRPESKTGPMHSRKPEAFLDLVEQVSPGPYLELFARRQRLGWDTWGNEALEHVEIA
jgi:N6-adenosine-specific RNA methylase IME4